MFGKLVDGNLKILKMPIQTQTEQIFTNVEELIRNYGYKPVRYIEPEAMEGFFVSGFAWVENEADIVQAWNYTEVNFDE